MNQYALAVCAALSLTWAAGCPTSEPTPEPESEPDTAPDGPRIVSFESDAALITAGLDARNEPVRGAVHIAYEVRDAASARLFFDTLPIAACETDCADQVVTHHPSASGTYRLVASGDGEPCLFNADQTLQDPTRCAMAELPVETVAPARMTLTAEPGVVAAGGSVDIGYQVERAASFELGFVTLVGGVRAFEPCPREDEAEAGARCVLPVVDGAPAATGTITISDVQAGFTIAGRAIGTAPDGLGGIDDGLVELSIGVEGAPTVTALQVADATLSPGATIDLSFTVDNSESIQVTAAPNNVEPADLAACAATGSLPDGGCTIQIAEGAPLEPIVLTVVATHPDHGDSAPRSVSVSVGARPSLTSSVAPLVLPEGGGTAQVGWQSANATNIQVFDVESPHTPLLDIEGDVGTDACSSGCLLLSDAVSVDLIVTRTFQIEAVNEFGRTAQLHTISVEGSPTITTLSAADQDLLAQPDLILDGPSVDVAYQTANATSSTLARADAPTEGCAPTLEFVADEQHDGAVAGTISLQDVVRATCFRITAAGGAGQTSSVYFRVVRVPEVILFAAEDDTVNHTQPIEIALDAANASTVTFSVAPPGAVSEDDLRACPGLDHDGHVACAFPIQPGTPLGTITIGAQLTGQLGTMSSPQEAHVTVGAAAQVASFTATPETLDAEADVTLSWESVDATTLRLLASDGTLLFETVEAAEVAAGSFVVSVAATTSFRAVADNLYGGEDKEATVFLGPSFGALAAGADDALDGLAAAVTGPVDLMWATANADSVALHATAGAPGGTCQDEDPGSFTSPLASGAAEGSGVFDNLVHDVCVDAIAENLAGQTSRVTFLLKDLPEAGPIAASPGSISASGGTLVVAAAARGAEALNIEAVYLDDQGAIISTRTVCHEGTLNSGEVIDDAENRDITCSDEYDNPGSVFCQTPGLCRTIPAGASSIRYRVRLEDAEGDVALQETDASGDVTVTP